MTSIRLRPKEPRSYNSDQSNGKLEDHIRDVYNWVDFY